MTDVIITSPCKGWAAALEEAPDPVFADRMMGDGLVIHPLEGTVRAPCAGTIRTIHSAGHAVTLADGHGVELLIHVGVDTVALAGAGFEPVAREGQAVSGGQPLLSFDLDAVGRRATSLVTPIIVTNPDRFMITWRAEGAVEPGDPLMRLAAVAVVEVRAASNEEAVRRTVVVPLPHGIHARPAARLGSLAKTFDADVAIVRGDRRGDIRSPMELLTLAIGHGDEIMIEARGRDAAAAAEAIAALLLSGMGEAALAPVVADRKPMPADELPPGQLAGVVASPGLAMGRAFRLDSDEVEVAEHGGDPAAERAALASATEAVRSRIAALARSGTEGTRAVMEAHLALLDDPALLGAADRRIDAGAGAGAAWRDALRVQADALRATGDARLVERIDDLLDIERQVLRRIAGLADAAADIPDGSVLLARDLLPSQLVALDLGRIAGLCLERGGPTSHVSILCASGGVPALVAMGDALGTVAESVMIALDADAGRLIVEPDAETVMEFTARVEQRRARRAAAEAAAQEECRTADGVRIEVFANLGSAEDARVAVACGAEGSGLLRSEFLFLERAAAPDVAEQQAAYQEVADAMEGRPVIVRLLDIGGDKPAPYLPIDAEENPALGLRGVRVSLRHRELLDTQLRAILGVRPAGQCRIMLPMIASVAEVREVRATLDRLRAELRIETRTELGVMVETPAAAVTADLLAAEVDFLSIGSNDLAQYVLAMDRGNPAVAAGVDALHPAVLRLIDQSCALAASKGRWTGLCGGLASDAAAIPILIGLGVTELSAVPGFVPEAKAIVRGLTMERCRDHAARALALSSAAEVRALAQAFVQENAA